jgi:hypothetical protein
MIGDKEKERAAGQGSFVSCEARQSGVLPLLPVSKGSAQWHQNNRQAELEVQSLPEAISE